MSFTCVYRLHGSAYAIFWGYPEIIFGGGGGLDCPKITKDDGGRGAGGGGQGNLIFLRAIKVFE